VCTFSSACSCRIIFFCSCHFRSSFHCQFPISTVLSENYVLVLSFSIIFRLSATAMSDYHSQFLVVSIAKFESYFCIPLYFTIKLRLSNLFAIFIIVVYASFLPLYQQTMQLLFHNMIRFFRVCP